MKKVLSSVLALMLALGLLAGCQKENKEPAAPAEPSYVKTEVAAAAPRVAISYDGGVQVLDGSTLEVLADVPYDGFTRLNLAGDGRHHPADLASVAGRR